MTELENFQSEIESFLDNEEFNIFPFEKSNFFRFFPEIKWSDSENWEEFFLIAKNEGVSTIFERIEMFTQSDLESLQIQDNEELKDDKEIQDHYRFFM